MRIVVDSLGGLIDTHTWGLVAPATVVFDTVGTRIDSVGGAQRRGRLGRAARPTLPNTRPVSLSVRADSVSLADLGAVAQLATPVSGTATGTMDISGLAHVAHDHARRALQRRDVRDRGVPVLHAQRIVRESAARHEDARVPPRHGGRCRSPDRGRSTSRSCRWSGGCSTSRSRDISPATVSTSAFSRRSRRRSRVRRAPHRWRSTSRAPGGIPLLTGRMRVRNGEMGLPALGTRLRKVEADVGFRPDSIRIDTLSAASGTEANSKLSLRGALALGNLLDLSQDLSNVQVDLSMSAHNFPRGRQALARAPRAQRRRAAERAVQPHDAHGERRTSSARPSISPSSRRRRR